MRRKPRFGMKRKGGWALLRLILMQPPYIQAHKRARIPAWRRDRWPAPGTKLRHGGGRLKTWLDLLRFPEGGQRRSLRQIHRRQPTPTPDDGIWHAAYRQRRRRWRAPRPRPRYIGKAPWLSPTSVKGTL